MRNQLFRLGIPHRQEEYKMSKIDVVRAAMVEAMKAKDKERKDSLSMLLSALKNAQIDKRDPLVLALKGWVDAEYEDGRQTVISAKELNAKIAELAPGRFAQV